MDTDRWLTPLVPLVTAYGLRVLGVLVAIWASFKISGWLERRVTGALLKRRFDRTLSIFFGNIVRWTILVAAVLACLSIFGIQTTSFAAIIAAAGLAIGLAFQGTLSNFASGVMLLVFRPFKVGDYVVAAAKEGTVAELGLFVTLLDTPDNRRICVSNSAIVGAPIENFTAHPVRRVDVDVNIAAGEDLDATRQALEAAAHATSGSESERAEVFLKGFGPGYVAWQVRVWAPPAVYWTVWQATLRAVGYELARMHISMPTPAMNVALSGGLAPSWNNERTGKRPIAR